jgi:hypothetical protein
MSTPEVVGHRPASVPPVRRVRALVAVGLARLLATQSPARIRAVLRQLAGRTPPATYAQAKTARDDVVAVSLTCAAREGCVPRSLAVVLLCRAAGRGVTWCVGARRVPPFGAHAWVEVDGRPVDEPYPADYFRTLFTEP